MPLPPPPLNEAPGARAYRQLKAWIDEGVLKAGDYLLPEQELSEKLEVARTTIRSILSRLEKEGVVRLTGRKRTVLGQGPAQQKSMRHTVGLLAPIATQTTTNGRIRLPGWSDNIQLGAVGTLHEMGFNVLYLPPHDLHEARLTQFLLDRPRGIIGFPQDVGGCPPLVPSALLRTKTPGVFYGSHADPQLRPFHVVTSDHAHGQQQLANLLMDRGMHNILRCWQATMTSPGVLPDWLQQRDAGALRALNERGQRIIPSVLIPHSQKDIACEEDFHHEVRTYAGYLAEYVLHSQPVDAIMAVTDGMVPYIAAALRLLGREPGRDILITGYDHYWADIRERRWEGYAPVASIDKNNTSIGIELARVLNGIIDGGIPHDPVEHRITPQLVTPRV